MSDSLLFFSLLSLPVILGGVVLFFGFRKRKRLTWGKARFFLSKMDAIGKKTAAERIVGYDKILDHVLADLWYRGTLGEKLKARPEILSACLDEIWELHKIRNRIVHDLENLWWGIELDAKRYERLLREIIFQKR